MTGGCVASHCKELYACSRVTASHWMLTLYVSSKTDSLSTCVSDRPESSLTHSSTESSDPTTEQPMSPTTPTTPTAPWPSEMGDKPAKTRRSFMGMIKSLRPPKASPPPPATAATPPPAPQRRMSTDSLRRGGLQRSQSGGSEAGLRASVRTNRASEARMAGCGKNTWSGGGRQRERPALGADTFRAPPPNRATSASPGPRRRAPPQPAASPAPRRKHSHLLADLMDDPELDDDAKVLQKMEELVRQYKPFLAQRQREVDGLSPPPGASSSVSPPPPPAPRVTPRKESGAGVGKSRIPAPTFFQQARSPTETCL